MFNFDKKYIDGFTLNEEFNLSNLFMIRERIFNDKKFLEKRKEILLKGLNLNDVKNLKNIEMKLHFLNKNIRIIEDIMILKENEIFKIYFRNNFCLN